MRTHINVIAWLQIVFGILIGLSCIVLVGMFLSIGNITKAPTPAVSSTVSHPNQTQEVSGVMDDTLIRSLSQSFNLAAGIVVGMVIVVAIPGVIAGIGLLRLAAWSRILAIVVSILDILSLNPLFIALGVYGLVILLSQESIALFQQPALHSLPQGRVSGTVTTSVSERSGDPKV